MNSKANILFLCTGNSCRSQMAEGWAKELKSEQYNFFSAGTEKHGLNPYAVQVMKEVGIDISSQTSNTSDEYSDIKFTAVFTVCSIAHESCPYFAGGKIIHRGFDDPPSLTQNVHNEAEKLLVYRRVRDEIREFILEMDSYFS